VDVGPPLAAEPRRRRRSALALVAAPILVLAIGATAIAGVGVIQMITTSSSGNLDIDDDIAKAGLECMTPPEAATWLADHGYKNVVWDTNAGHGTIQVGDSASALPVIDRRQLRPRARGGPAAASVSTGTTSPAEGASPRPTIDRWSRVDTSPADARRPAPDGVDA
jgi:hypothetical protein